MVKAPLIGRVVTRGKLSDGSAVGDGDGVGNEVGGVLGRSLGRLLTSQGSKTSYVM